MNAQHIYDSAPFGALIRYSDGTPQPPLRFRRKLEDWSRRNDQGYLTQKNPAVTGGSYHTPDRFTLRKTGFSESEKPIAFIFNLLVTVASPLAYEIVSVPIPGQVLIFSSGQEHRELVHLAADESAARLWLTHHGYPDALLEILGPPTHNGAPIVHAPVDGGDHG
jgi:hypothetical protein